MNRRLVYFALSAALLAACGGGGGASGAAPVPSNPGGGTTPASQGNIPVQGTVSGAAAWVDPSSQKTLYFLDVDTATGATCTGSCLGLWPVFTPSAGATGTANMTVITRSDGAGLQWSYQTHPLYTYAGDTGPLQANGDNFPDFGGHWHVARPSASTATPPPSGGNPCTGLYC